MPKKKRRRTDSRTIPTKGTGEAPTPEPDPGDQPVRSRARHHEPLIAGSRTVTITGPIPPPQLLCQYEELLPGSADRIIRMAEKATDHEMETGKRVVEGVLAERRRGQLSGTLVVFAVLVCSGWALYLGHEDFAMTLGGWTLTGVAAIFVLGRLPDWFRGLRSQSDETKRPGHGEAPPSR
ncbi:DUF2335 domain-containing protein [Candidatus Palauibacter sp.]|uniref:DUF2335 domain-containing protein n=1 Tax=Candidatus Palauibacter sp. TaxID=3101350 RepID=UPI003AF278ED